MPKVLVLGKIHQDGVDRLRAESAVRVEELAERAPDLLDRVSGADAIIVRMTPINREVIDAAPNLLIVARHGVGYDSVDVGALTGRGIPLALVGDVNSGAVAEHTLALMLGLARNVVAWDQATRRGNFAIRDTFSARELSGKTVLIAGFGRVTDAKSNRVIRTEDAKGPCDLSTIISEGMMINPSSSCHCNFELKGFRVLASAGKIKPHTAQPWQERLAELRECRKVFDRCLQPATGSWDNHTLHTAHCLPPTGLTW